jgi:hypothetical protein
MIRGVRAGKKLNNNKKKAKEVRFSYERSPEELSVSKIISSSETTQKMGFTFVWTQGQCQNQRATVVITLPVAKWI